MKSDRSLVTSTGFSTKQSVMIIERLTEPVEELVQVLGACGPELVLCYCRYRDDLGFLLFNHRFLRRFKLFDCLYCMNENIKLLT
jgi:hypothetical protein